MPSIVEFYSDNEGYKCGYCKQAKTAFSKGMWAHSLTVEDYESLLNRGWRRSGKYCYKPIMDKTCCPQYEIKSDATKVKASKSQKKVMRKMKNFLQNGGGSGEGNSSNQVSGDGALQRSEIKKAALNENAETPSTSSPMEVDKKKTEPKKGTGFDPSRGVCKKAKVRRMEKKQAKLASKGLTLSTKNKVLTDQPAVAAAQLEDQLPHLKQVEGGKHKLEVKLVQSQPMSEEFKESLTESFELYKKYQVMVHDDDENDCEQEQWKRFLVSSPLTAKHDEEKDISYGSFHNQYWMDGKLIAVGVVDILPSTISSVYVYYDIEHYASLSLGVYTALSELSLVRSYNALDAEMRYYCLGYYIETCGKMRYKGQYNPSYLLCPETYRWVNLEKCRETLRKSPYARLNVLDGGSPTEEDGDRFAPEACKEDLAHVLVLYRQHIHRYHDYRNRKLLEDRSLNVDDLDAELGVVHEYASLVGRSCSQRMVLYRHYE